MSHTQEPFGYFKAEPFGWTDCAESDEGAHPLYDLATVDAISKQRDEAEALLDMWLWETVNERTEHADARARTQRYLQDRAIASVKGGAA